MKKALVRLYCLFTLVFFLAGWVNTVTPGSFHNVMAYQPFGTSSQEILISTKEYDAKESKEFLEKDYLAKEIVPVQITITNNTAYSFSICNSSFDLNSISVKDIIRKVGKESIPRKIAYSIAGFFFWPFSIPSLIDGLVSKKLLKKYTERLNAKSIKDEVLAPYSTVTRVLFVKKGDLKSEFNITFIELETLKPYVYHYINGQVTKD